MQIRLLMQVALLALISATAQSTAQAQSDTDDNEESVVASEIISRDVLVANGDTLFSIAERELGRAGLAPMLAEFNGLVSSAPLVPGNIVRIPIHVPARDEYAEVVFVKGDVIAIRTSVGGAAGVVAVSSDGSTAPDANSGASEIALERDARVRAGDTIITGVDGYISIEFSSGSVINLQPDTEAILNRLNCLPDDDSCVIELRALRGNVTSDVEDRDNQPVDFRISTPYASAAVRGTVFDLNANSNVLIVGVTEGDVDLSALDQSVPLTSGFGSVVEEGQPPSEPVALLPPPVFRRVPARLAPGDAVTWWPFDEAESYGALVSNDEAGNESLANFVVEQNSIGFDSIDPGDYFLLLRALDDLGLQGFISNTRITIASIDESITPVETTVERQGREFLVTVIDPPVSAIGFEMQISNNESFDDPLSVDVDSTGSAVFRLDDDQVFTRARILLDPLTVSAFGEVTSSEN